MSNYKKLYLYVPTDNSRSGKRGSDIAYGLNSRELSENMVWEHLQNALDARDNEHLPVGIKVKNCTSIKKRPNGKQYWSDLTKQTEEIYKKSFNQNFELSDQALILQETNTVGLIGEACYKPKPSKKEEAKEWNITNFLYRDGEESKDGTKRGSTGNGKATYTYITDLGMFLVITHRVDGKVAMAGQVFFPQGVEDKINDVIRSYWGSFTLEDDEKKLDKHWSDEEYDKVVAPIWDEKIIKEHSSFFGLDLDKDIKAECGTTFVFPSPKIKPVEYLNEAIKSFYWAIFRGDLVLEHHSTKIDKDSISDICKEQLGGNRFWDFLTEITKFDDNSFIEVQDDWALENAKNIDLKDFLCSSGKSKIESEENNLLGFKFPLKIDNDTGTTDSFVKVFYQYDSEESTGVVARNDFIISGESTNFFPKYFKGFGFVLIDDQEIFKLVRASEGPDHTKFIKKILRKKIKAHKKFKNGEKVLDQIRSAPKQVIDLFDSKHDAELENFMSSLLSFKKKQEKKKKKTIKTKTTKTTTGGGAQPPSRKLFKCELEGTTNNYQIHFNKGASSLTSNDLPFRITIRVDSQAHIGEASTKGVDLGENGFLTSTLVNQNNINIIQKEPGEIILEVIDEDFQGTLESIDFQHAGTMSIFRS
jgi:hypothetical protein